MKRNLLRRNADFRKVWVAQVLSQGGSKAYLINLLWWIIARAESVGGSAALASGALLVLAALPSILLVKVIGRTLTKRPAKTVMVVAEAAGAVLITLLFVLVTVYGDSLPLAAVYAVTVLVSICQAHVDPALTKSVGELVDAEDIEGAVGFEAATQSLAYFIGTAAGATLTGMLGFKAAILLNIASYAVSAATTATARFRPSESAVGPAAGDALDLTAVPWVKSLLYAFAGANFLLFPLFLVLPLFTKTTLQADVVTLGGMEACFWLGLICGAAASRFFSDDRSMHTLVAVLLAIFGTFLATIVLIPNAFWTGFVLFIGGSTAGIVNVKVITYFQKTVPDGQKGDFFARLQALVTATQPLGYLVFTYALVRLPAPTAFAADGLGLVAVAGATYIAGRLASA